MLKEVNMKELIEYFGGKCLFGGSLIQFNEDSFKEMYRQIYDAGMLTEREACAKLADEYADGLERNYSKAIADKIRARMDHQ